MANTADQVRVNVNELYRLESRRILAIDAMRRRSRFDDSQPALAERLSADAGDPTASDDESIEDDRLRLIFTCCHPALSPDAGSGSGWR